MATGDLLSTLRWKQKQSQHFSVAQVEWTKDEAGRWKIEEVPDSEKVYPCQLVLLAMGFLGPESEVLDSINVAQDPRSNVKTETGKFSTSVRGVFAAGDCRRGQSLVVWAITEGRQAAREIDDFLTGDSFLPVAGGIIHPKSVIKEI